MKELQKSTTNENITLHIEKVVELIKAVCINLFENQQKNMKLNLKFFSNKRTVAKQEIRKLRDEINKLKKASSLLKIFLKDKVSKVE